jgi:hypothetical protein
MNVIRERLDPMGKPLGIGHDVCAAVPGHLPAIIDHNVLVARVFHRAADHRPAIDLIKTSLTLHPNLFQLFHPIGGICANSFSVARAVFKATTHTWQMQEITHRNAGTFADFKL